MKIIDLINKINNNEEIPKKIKYEDIIFEYDKDRKEYIHKLDDWCSETILFKAMNENTYFIQDLLKIEVEVIEENKEIDTINAYKLIEEPYLADCLKEKKFNEVAKMLKQSELEIVERVNDLVYAVKELIKEREEK